LLFLLCRSTVGREKGKRVANSKDFSFLQLGPCRDGRYAGFRIESCGGGRAIVSQQSDKVADCRRGHFHRLRFTIRLNYFFTQMFEASSRRDASDTQTGHEAGAIGFRVPD